MLPGFRPHPRVILPAQQRAASVNEIFLSLTTTDSVTELYAAAPFRLELNGDDIFISFKQPGVVAARVVLVTEDNRKTFVADIVSKGDEHNEAVQRFSLGTGLCTYPENVALHRWNSAGIRSILWRQY